MSGYSNWPHNWPVPYAASAAAVLEVFTKTAIPPGGPLRREGYTNRRAWRAALSQWRHAHG